MLSVASAKVTQCSLERMRVSANFSRILILVRLLHPFDKFWTLDHENPPQLDQQFLDEGASETGQGVVPYLPLNELRRTPATGGNQ